MKKYLFFIFFLLVYNVNAQVDDSDEKVSISKNKIEIPGYIKLDFGFTFLIPIINVCPVCKSVFSGKILITSSKKSIKWIYFFRKCRCFFGY